MGESKTGFRFLQNGFKKKKPTITALCAISYNDTWTIKDMT